ncbi:MAG: PEGA domain-containing protein [Halobacteriota archaeon]|nr:PEGA domain-containing protein [Halobacteriota archaeon]
MKQIRIIFVLLVLIIISFGPASAIMVTNLTLLSNANGCAPTWSPDGKKIAFGNGMDIWIIDVDNTNLTPFTGNLSFSDLLLNWSTDGNNMAHNVTNLTSLTEDVSLSFDWVASWSPDGNRIAFMSSKSGNFDIWVMDVDGSNLKQLTTSPEEEGYPAWSPDGTKIAFFSGRSDNLDIWVMDLNSGELSQLTTHPKNDIQPAWSPDGKMIAFASFRGRKIDTDIWVMDADGGNLKQLTTDRADDDHPSWSPDGKMIAFRSDRSGNSDIWVMNVDGTNQTQLTTDPEVDECCAWGPEGRLAFGSKRSGVVNVWLATIDLKKDPSPPPQPGTITISSYPPRVDLFIDGYNKGRTPKTVHLQPGVHQIKLRRTGFTDEVIDIEVPAGGTENLSVSLTPISKPTRSGSFFAVGGIIGVGLIVALLLYLVLRRKS